MHQDVHNGWRMGARALLLGMLMGVAGVARAVELAWPADADGAAMPAGWELERSPASKGEAHFDQGRLLLSCEATRHLHVTRALGVDGTDQAPLTVECRIAVETAVELGGMPTTVALYWGTNSVVSIGLGGMEVWPERWNPWRRRAWSYWINGAEKGFKRTETPVYSGAAPAYFRFVLTSHDLSAYASADGVHYQPLATFERKPDQFAGAPERIIIGRGWVGDQPELQKPHLANDVPLGDPNANGLVTWIIDALHISTETPRLPPAQNLGKAKGWDDAREAYLASTTVKRWSLLGPLPPSDKPYGPESALDLKASFKLADGKEGGWTPYTADDNAGPGLNLKVLLKMSAERQCAFASSTITADAAHDERISFDGSRELWLYVNGRLVADTTRNEINIVPDRLVATVPFKKGDNLVVVKCSSAWDGHCSFAFRHDPAPLTQRIANLKRLIADLPDDLDNVVAAVQEIARWWEALGCRRQAADALAEILSKENATPEQVDAACFERARLHQLLRDRAAVIADVEELAKRRLAAKGKATAHDAVDAQLKLARLWEQMGFLDKGLEAVEGMLKTDGIVAEQIIDGYGERVRLHQLLKQDAQIPSDLRELAARLPADHPERFEIVLHALALDLAAGRDASVAQALQDAGQEHPDRQARLARMHNLLAGYAEAKGDQPDRLAHLRAVIDNRRIAESSWESLRVECAEAMLASGKPDEPTLRAAIEHYRQALTLMAAGDQPLVAAKRAEGEQALSANKPAAALQALRSAYVRGCLAASPAGERLLQQAVNTVVPDAGAVGARNLLLTPLIRDWYAIGPFDNANWQCYDKPPVEVGKVDLLKEVQGKKWIRPGLDFYQNGILDLSRLFKQQNCVAFVYREIDALAPFDGELSCGADDGLVLWFNGAKIHEDRQQRAAKPGDMVMPVHFAKGSNVILAMIQQGGGEWGFTLRVNSAQTQAIDLAQVLSLIEKTADGRGALAAAFGELIDAFATNGQLDEAMAVARVVTRAFPERPEVQLAAADRLLELGKTRTLREAGDVVAWMDAYAERRAFADKERYLAEFRPRAAEALRAAGDLSAAATMLRRIQRSSFDGDTQTRMLVQLGDLYRIAGYPRTAADYYHKAAERPITDDALRRQVQDGLFHVRAAKADNTSFALSIDAGTLVQTADRAAGAGDIERALRSYQRAIDQHGDELFRLDASKIVGIAEYVADRIGGLGEAGLASYRKLFDARAGELYQQAVAANDQGLFARVAHLYPASSIAATALEQAGNLALDAGHGERAAALFASVLTNRTGAARALLLAKYAQALTQAGDLSGARAALDRLAADGVGIDLTIKGKPIKADVYAAERRKALDAVPPATASWPTTGGSARRTGYSANAPVPTACRFETSFPVHPADQIAADRFVPSPYQHLMVHAAVDGGAIYFHTLDEAFAIDLVSGALRWRSSVAFPALRRAERQDGFAGMPETMTSVADGRVLVRVLHRTAAGAAFAIESRDAASGALRWSTETDPATVDASAISSPAVAAGVVVAVFQDVNERFHNFAAAFSAADGHLLWRTPLASGLAELTLITQQEIPLGDHLAAPSIAGSDVYVCTDMGGVVAMDVASGAVRWAATYPRALLDPVSGRETVRQLANRAASRVLVGSDALYVAPRDSLAVLCIARANGDVRWRRELNDCRALVGLAPEQKDKAGHGDGGRLVMQGNVVECVSGVNGERLWRWKPSGQMRGIAALGGGSVYVASDAGLCRVALADGREQACDSWTKLGVEGGPIGNLLLFGDALLGVGRDRCVVLQATTATRATTVIANAAAATVLPITSLPPAEFGSPALLRWHLTTGANARIVRSPESSDELYLMLDDRLVRINAAKSQVAWDAPCAPGALRLEISHELVLALYQRTITAYDQASGRMLWSRPMIYDDAGFSLEQLDQNEHFYDEVSASPAAVAVRRHLAKQVEILDPRNGTVINSVTPGGVIHWTGMIGGELFAVIQVGDKMAIESRAPATGALAWSKELSGSHANNHQFAAVLSADHAILYLCFNNAVSAFDLAQRKEIFSQPANLGEYLTARLEGDYLVTFSRRDREKWFSVAVDTKAGKVVLEQETHRGEWSFSLSPYLFVGDRAVHTSSMRKRDTFTVVCRSMSGDKELWTTDIDGHWKDYYTEEVAGKYLIQVFGNQQNRDHRLFYYLIDLENGRIAGEGELPGLHNGHDFTGIYAGGTLVYNTVDGIYAVGGVQTTPGKRPVEAACDQLRALVSAPSRDNAGASEFIASYSPDLRPALFTNQQIRIDGHLDEWQGIEPIELARPLDVRLEGAAWNGPKDCSAKGRVMWDRRFVYLSAEVIDDQHQAPVAGADPTDGDSLLIGIDPDGAAGSGDDLRPIVLALALVDGRTRLTQLSGRTVETAQDDESSVAGKTADEDKAAARVVRRGDGLVYELALPWSVIRPNPSERPGRKTGMGLGLAVIDWDGGKPKAAVEWGYGLVRGIGPRRFGQVAFIDLTPERIASYRAFIAAMPTHDFAWRFIQNIAATHIGPSGLPGRISEVENFLKTYPATVHASLALTELGRLYTNAGFDKPADKVAQFAGQTGVAARAIGDAVGPGPATKDQGRAFRQWIYIDPARPPQTVLLQFRSTTEDWNHRVYWGLDTLPWGERDTSQHWPLGPLPPAGQWVALTVPVAALRIDGQLIDNLSFAVHGGTVNWGRTEYVEDGKVQVLIDGEAPKGAGFDKSVQWSDQPAQNGRKSHTVGYQGGDSEYHFAANGAIQVDLRAKTPAAEVSGAANKERLLKGVQAAKLIPETDEALLLLREGEALFQDQGEKRTDAVLAMYTDFLKSYPANQQAYKVLNNLRNMLENWTNGKNPALRASALTRCEAIMDEAKLGREQRRLFYGQFSPTIAEWKVLGYFDAAKGAQNIQEALAPERGEIDLDMRYQSAHDRVIAWRDIQADWNVLNIAGKMHDHEKHRWPLAYAYARFEAANSAEVDLFLGCKGQCVVWVNGKRVGGVIVGERNFQRDAFILPCKLLKGINEILIKTSEYDGNQAISCRFADHNGRPVEGLVSRLPPSLISATSDNPTSVTVTFSGPVEQASAETIANYAIDHGVEISSATLSKERRSLVLVVSPLTKDVEYQLSLSNVRNPAGTPIKTNSRLRFHLAAAGVGNGLKGEYFSGRDFANPLLTRIDATVDFDWGDSDTPDAAVPHENFCVRWTGQVMPLYAETYTFTTLTDDGARLWVNGQLLVDHWVDQAATESSGTIALEAGKRYDIKMEYYQGAVTAVAKLMWSSARQEKEIIPASQLFARPEKAEAPAPKHKK